MNDCYVIAAGSDFSPEPEDNVMDSIFKQYERVIIESLISSFGLDFLVGDQHGGDVDTIHNVRQIGKDEDMTYKNDLNKNTYENHGTYDKYIKAQYDSDPRFTSINGEFKKQKKTEKEIDKICSYMKELSSTATKFYKAISTVNDVYINHMNKLSNIVELKKKTDWSAFTEEERLITENTALLVNLLFKMGKVQLVLASGNDTEPNRVNNEAVNKSMSNAETFLSERGLSGVF